MIDLIACALNPVVGGVLTSVFVWTLSRRLSNDGFRGWVSPAVWVGLGLVPGLRTVRMDLWRFGVFVDPVLTLRKAGPFWFLGLSCVLLEKGRGSKYPGTSRMDTLSGCPFLVFFGFSLPCSPSPVLLFPPFSSSVSLFRFSFLFLLGVLGACECSLFGFELL